MIPCFFRRPPVEAKMFAGDQGLPLVRNNDFFPGFFLFRNVRKCLEIFGMVTKHFSALPKGSRCLLFIPEGIATIEMSKKRR